MIEHTLVLRGNPGDQEDLEQIHQVIENGLGKEGLAYRYMHSESPDADTTIHKWFGDRKGELIKVVDDVRLPARYLSIESHSQRLAAAAAARLQAALSVMSLSELREEAATSAVDSPGSLVRLALGTDGQFDLASAEVIDAALHHASTAVRSSAAMASALLAWPELAAALADAKEREYDDATLRLLQYALAKCADE